jgi:hypothetical protein
VALATIAAVCGLAGYIEACTFLATS